MDVSAGKDFCRGEIFEIFVIGNHIDRIAGTFKVMSPSFESFEDSEKLFVMGVIIELCSLKSS